MRRLQLFQGLGCQLRALVIDVLRLELLVLQEYLVPVGMSQVAKRLTGAVFYASSLDS